MMQERLDSFWGHVDDLRQTGLRTLFIIGIGFVVLLAFYYPILQVFTDYPTIISTENLVEQRVERFQIANHTSKEKVFALPHDALVLFDNSLEPKREYLLKPGETLLYEQPIKNRFLIMGPIEGLTLVFKVCFWLSIALTAPLWGWVWIKFILPGINHNERAVFFPFLLFSVIFICLGVSLAFYVTLPIANEYLTQFNSTLGQNAWTLEKYVNYFLFLCLGHAIAAELGFLLLVLVHYRFLSPVWLISKRRTMIVVAFILGAVLTPPDVLTQLLLALPLIGLYEIAILYAKWRNPSQAQAIFTKII